MAQTGVYVESPLDRIVDVHFGGLAVHFGEKDQPPVEPAPEMRKRLVRGPGRDELHRIA
jgi:hypothetical protein